MRIVALDIETIADPDAFAAAAAYPPEFEAPANYKDPVKIAAVLQERREAWVGSLAKQLATDPLTAQVVSAAVYAAHPGAPVVAAAMTLNDVPTHTEAELLREVWAFLADYDAVATFNGASFDGPALMLRSARRGVVPTLDLTTRRGAYAPNCDLLDFVVQGRGLEAKKGKKLEAVAAILGIPFSKGGMDGSQVGEYVADGRWDEISRYNLGDAGVTWNIYERLRGVIPGHADSRAFDAARHDARVRNEALRAAARRAAVQPAAEA